MKRTGPALLLMLICCFLAVRCNLPENRQDQIWAEIAGTQIAAVIQTELVPTATIIPTRTPVPTRVPTRTPVPTFTPTLGPSPTPTLGPEYFHGSIWYEPEFVTQEGLKYKGTKINTGCTAASVQMVLDFWHAYKEEYPTITAQQLLNLNIRQNAFNPGTGLNIMSTEDELKDLNYYLGTRMDSNRKELLEALERYGPLMVLTKVNWTPRGGNHMAVVTGYDPENDIIRVLDPWQSTGIMEFSYDSFDGIWSLNYLNDEKEVLRRTFFFIVPYAELARENEPFIPEWEMSKIRLEKDLGIRD